MISALEFDLMGAGISVVSVVPYLGDVSKVLRIPKWLATLTKASKLLDKGGAAATAIAKSLKPWADQMWSLFNRIDWKMVERNFPDFLAVRDKIYELINKIDSILGIVRKAESKVDDVWALYRSLGCFVAGTPVRIAVAANDSSPFSDDFDPYSWNRTEELVCRAALAIAPEVATTAAVSIERVPLGARILTENPRPEDVDYSLPEPEQASWRRIAMRIVRHDGAVTEIQLLLPLAWIENLGLAVGRFTPAQYPELNLHGTAEVTAIDPCPEIDEGLGAVVTGTVVTYNARNLVRVLFSDGEELVGTDLHPIWNVTDQNWTPMGKLAHGDFVLARGTPLAVTSISRLTAEEPVYNLEVHGHHVYEAGTSGVLVHNNDPACEAFRKGYDELIAAGKHVEAAAFAQERLADLQELRRLGQLSAEQLEQLDDIESVLAFNAVGIVRSGNRSRLEWHFLNLNLFQGIVFGRRIWGRSGA